MEFETTVHVFCLPKAFHAVDRAANVIVLYFLVCVFIVVPISLIVYMQQEMVRRR
jgi:hypothetical protein